MSDENLCLEVERKDHSATRIAAEPLGELRSDTIRFRVERFALTANNVTYAVFGDALGYWGFFPVGAQWGRVPAMGWGEVVASAHPGIATGGRYYGWFPMARYLDVLAAPAPEGLRDAGGHREKHAPVYRAFTATERDPFYAPGGESEDRHALLRGLFLTAFLADDFFAEQGYFGAARALVLSASSKTAIGFAQRAAARGLDAVIGLTSSRNLDFVARLGCYDRVVAYDDIETLPVDADAVSIDMSGNGRLLERLHAHLGNRLRHSMAIGRSHHDAPRVPQAISGPRPELFFAPARVSKRVRDWGPQGYQERLAEALRGFVDASRGWLEVRRSHGPDAAVARWRAVLGGQVPPNVGHVVSLWDA